MPQRQLSESEWNEWLAHPVTKLLHVLLAQRVEEFKTMWSKGHFTAQDQFGTAIANACAIGECKAYEAISDLDADQVNKELNE